MGRRGRTRSEPADARQAARTEQRGAVDEAGAVDATEPVDADARARRGPERVSAPEIGDRHEASWSTVAGHRVVRRMHDGPISVVVVGGDPALEAHVAVRGDRETARLMADEADALALVPHLHIAPVLDVAVHDGAPVMLRPLRRASLGAWLAERGAPAPGEVVTAVAPIAGAIAAMHARGVVGAAIDGEGVVLDDDGAPQLLGRGARIATARPTPAWMAQSEAVRTDASALVRLVGTMLDAAGAQPDRALADALDARDLERIESALLAAWPALPLAFERRERERTATVRDRVRARPAASVVRAGLVGAVAEALTAGVHRVGDALRQVRRPIWVAFGLGVAALGMAAVVPAFASDSQPPTDVVATDGAPASDQPADVAQPSAAAPDAAVPDGAEPDDATSGESEPSDAASADDAPADDAPADAVLALIAAREPCLDASDEARLECLATIEDPSGLLHAADAAGEPTWRMPPDAVPTIVQQWGDAVLVDIASETSPASVLAVSTEAGWRLREAWASSDGVG